MKICNKFIMLFSMNLYTFFIQREIIDGRDKVDIFTDRPPLVSFAACAGEVAKIGAKIVGCLATGKIVGHMVNTQASDKVRMAVSTALLALSALNIAVPIREKEIT
jgi:hypothetical protein